MTQSRLDIEKSVLAQQLPQIHIDFGRGFGSTML